MKTVLRLAIIALLAGSTNQSTSKQSEVCLSDSHAKYIGVALAISTGDATFATANPYCAYRINGSSDVYDRIFQAWLAAPYEGEIRPIFISLEGKVGPGRSPNEVMSFDVKAVRKISAASDESDATKQFKRRFNTPLPRHRIGIDKDAPNERYSGI